MIEKSLCEISDPLARELQNFLLACWERISPQHKHLLGLDRERAMVETWRLMEEKRFWREKYLSIYLSTTLRG